MRSARKDQGVNSQTGFSLADLLLGLGASQEVGAGRWWGGRRSVHVIEFSQADFKKSGRLGCAACYQTFAEGLEGLLKSMHKGTRHSGKCLSLRQKRDYSDSYPSCRGKLAKTIEAENFEAAAQLR